MGGSIFVYNEGRKDKGKAYLRADISDRASDLISELRSDYIMFWCSFGLDYVATTLSDRLGWEQN